jgi:hypothetical protein
MVQNTFIGDGPSVSPPMNCARIPKEWCGLETPEEKILEFGREVLSGLGFSQGVFHIEARERHSDHKLVLIEVNPRAPGGSLWKSALLRTGYDLELIDVAIQLGKPIPGPIALKHKNVLHYPFYATNPGVLIDWGDLANPVSSLPPDLAIDFAVKLGHVFYNEDMFEEPDLGFVVTHDKSVDGLLAKFQNILKLNPPTIKPLL